MNTLIHCGFVSTAVIARAAVSALAGFAFSAAAGSVLLCIMPPTHAVPLMTLCSILVQATSVLVLKNASQWKRSLVLLGVGLAAIIPAIYSQQHVDVALLRVCFGPLAACGVTGTPPPGQSPLEAPGGFTDNEGMIDQ